MNFLENLHIINSWTGLIHTIFAILSMVFGTIIFLNKKGTLFHKRIGYAYVISMALLNITAFAIYNFGSLSLFHFFAVVSLFSIAMGLIPAIKKTKEKWQTQHYYFMNWSVVGLYCAFWAELGVRFFDMRYFWWVVMLATMATSFLGALIINREAKKLNL